jgi:mannose-1-phosphate guanylyltransferase/mannose-6-phosphate isomerase
MTLQITPVLLVGGSGTRLWPLSRKSYPKQFAPLIGQETLFQASAKRLSGAAQGLDFTAPLTMTNSDFRFIVTEQLAEAGVDPGAILIEPEGRNTAPAVLAAALYLAAKDPEAVMLVAPSDHVIPDSDAFRAAVRQGLSAVEQGQLVTFGITPDRPETGYGYLNLTAAPDGSGAAIPLERFVEKPDLATAEEMLKAGTYLWNAGIFLFRARDILAAFEAHAPGLIGPVGRAVAVPRGPRLAAMSRGSLMPLSVGVTLLLAWSTLVMVRNFGVGRPQPSKTYFVLSLSMARAEARTPAPT